MLARLLLAPLLAGGLTAGTLTAAAAPTTAGREASDEVAEEARPLAFVAGRAPLRHARAGERWSADVGGLTVGGEGAVRFSKVRGADWVTVRRDGTLTGRPSARDARRGEQRVVVAATDADGATARTTATVEVRRAGERLVPELKVMSWNLWHGGTRVSDHHAKQVRFLLRHDVDVVGVQEGNASTAALAEALGWHHHTTGSSTGVLSRYPLVRRGPQRAELPAVDAVVELDRRRQERFALWNVHLGYTPYGPYDACFGQMTEAELMAREVESGRTPQIEGVVAAMRGDLRRSDDVPVLLTGDFNAPSHLDWTERTARCGYGDVAWPASTVPTDAGLVDTFRAVNPDPRRAPGITWSPIYDTFTGGYGHDEHTGEPEPQDRIDLVYATPGWRVLDSVTLVAGGPTPIPDHADNEWTSDHAAVLTTLRVR